MGKPEETLRQLVATAGSVVAGRIERVQPRGKATAHITQHLAGHESARDKHAQTDHHIDDSAGCHIDHDHKEAEVEQGCAEVSLANEHQQADRPNCQNRPEIAGPRQLNSHKLWPDGSQ